MTTIADETRRIHAILQAVGLSTLVSLDKDPHTAEEQKPGGPKPQIRARAGYEPGKPSLLHFDAATEIDALRGLRGKLEEFASKKQLDLLAQSERLGELDLPPPAAVADTEPPKGDLPS